LAVQQRLIECRPIEENASNDAVLNDFSKHDSDQMYLSQAVVPMLAARRIRAGIHGAHSLALLHGFIHWLSFSDGHLRARYVQYGIGGRR
jgi:hypothetical protein